MALLVSAMVTGLSAAAVDPGALLARVRAKILAAAETIPRYVCRQTLQRQTYAPAKKVSPTCGTLAGIFSLDPSQSETALALTSRIPGYTLVSSDRAKLDVMIADGAELFSWPGGGSFQTNNPGDLLGGGFAGNGDFAGFIITAFASGQTTFQYLGPCAAASCVRFAYDVPLSVGRYILENPLEKLVFGYHGTIDIDPQSASLFAATVIPTDLPKKMRRACDIRTSMMYERTPSNASEFKIPEVTAKEYLDADGWYFSNWIQYSGCRQYSAESSLRFDGDRPVSSPGEQKSHAPAQMPRRGATLELQLATRVDSRTSSAGDRVDAALVRSVRTAEGRTIPARTVVTGHLAEVEHTYYPKPSVKFAIRFETITLDGQSLPLSLSPVGQMDAGGRGVFTFSRDNVVLDDKFVSRWRVP